MLIHSKFWSQTTVLCIWYYLQFQGVSSAIRPRGGGGGEGERRGQKVGTVLETLYNKLLEGHNYIIRPYEEGKPMEPLTITFGVSLLEAKLDHYGSSIYLDTRLQLHMEWRDPRLSWDPNDYGGLKFISIQAWHIWSPTGMRLFMKNGGTHNHASTTYETIAKVRYDGLVDYRPFAFTGSSCRHFNMNDFPFDDQTCDLEFRSWEDQSMIQLRPWKNHTSVILDEYVSKISPWELVGANNYTLKFHTCSDGHDRVSIALTFRRNPSHYLHTYFLPFNFLALSIPILFLLDLRVRLIGSMFVVLGLALGTRPYIHTYMYPQDGTPPTLVRAQFWFMSLGVFVFLETVLINVLHKRNMKGETMPHWLQFTFLPRLRRIPVASANLIDDEDEYRLSRYDRDQMVQANGQQTDPTSKNTNTKNKNLWSDLGKVADKCFFWVCLLGVLGIYTRLLIAFSFFYKYWI